VLASLAAWREQRAAHGSDIPGVFAGHSLGEVSALAAAGAISEPDAIRLAVLRGELMARAAEEPPAGAMLAVIGGEAGQARSFAAQHNLIVANDNAPGQIVLAGARERIDRARRAARELGLRAVELDVVGAFHSPQMEPARQGLLRAFARRAWSAPRAPVFSGMTISEFTDPARELAQAVTAQVRWRELMLALRDRGVTRFVDVGPGEVLTKLVGRILKEDRDDIVVA
jgi:[acyl-carrier-protein] S-malonyltransferase